MLLDFKARYTTNRLKTVFIRLAQIITRGVVSSFIFDTRPVGIIDWTKKIDTYGKVKQIKFNSK